MVFFISNSAWMRVGGDSGRSSESPPTTSTPTTSQRAALFWFLLNFVDTLPQTLEPPIRQWVIGADADANSDEAGICVLVRSWPGNAVQFADPHPFKLNGGLTRRSARREAVPGGRREGDAAQRGGAASFRGVVRLTMGIQNGSRILPAKDRDRCHPRTNSRSLAPSSQRSPVGVSQPKASGATAEPGLPRAVVWLAVARLGRKIYTLGLELIRISKANAWGVPSMTIDKSLKVQRGLITNRSVLTRAERLAILTETERWKEGDPVLGLPKVRVRKLELKKKKKVKKEEETDAKAK